MEHYLPWLVPPLLGALIGYVTNFIAIKMLFRPLKVWRIFGLRVPLTPGIIPSKRGELAQRMGNTVGGHLLTSADIGGALETATFRHELRGALHDRLGHFLDRELAPPAALVPKDYRARFDELALILRRKCVDAVGRWVDSADCETRLRKFLADKERELLGRDLESFMTPERFAALSTHLDERIGTTLRSDALTMAVEQFVDRQTDRLLCSERSLKELLPDDLCETLIAQLEKELPPLLEKFGGMLHDPAFRKQLTTRAREGIEKFLDSLGGLTAVLAGFFDMEKVYTKIPDFLDQAGEEVAVWLQRAATQEQVAAMLRERINAFLDRPLKSYLEKMPFEKVAGMRTYLRARAITLLHDRRTTERLVSLAGAGIERIKDRPFHQLLDGILPHGGRGRIRDAFADRLLVTLRAPATGQAFDRFLADKFDYWLYQRPLGHLAARIPADLREELEEGIYLQLKDVLRQEVPPLIDALDITRMVEKKVNQLDLLQVEDLVLGIMKEQFKYINLFGGLLGFLIGLMNLFLLKL